MNAAWLRSVSSAGAARCRCRPTWQGDVVVNGHRKRRNFKLRAEAQTWSQDTEHALARGGIAAQPVNVTVAEAWERFLADARAGSILNRSGKPYAATTLDHYETSMRRRVLPALGKRKLAEVRPADVQALADKLTPRQAPATVRNSICPLQALYRWALRRGYVVMNPTRDVELPRGRGRRERVAQPTEADALIRALPEGDRALWATAIYAGLRRGELGALRVSDLDLDNRVIAVTRSYDFHNRQMKSTKTGAGERTVAMTADLHALLAEHILLTGRRGDDLVFGRTSRLPFTPSTIRYRALIAWGWKWIAPKKNSAGELTRKGEWVPAVAEPLEPLLLHEGRHTAASYLIGAGVSGKALSTYMGHSSTATTEDVYGHLLDGHEQETAAMMDAFLASARSAC